MVINLTKTLKTWDTFFGTPGRKSSDVKFNKVGLVSNLRKKFEDLEDGNGKNIELEKKKVVETEGIVDEAAALNSIIGESSLVSKFSTRWRGSEAVIREKENRPIGRADFGGKVSDRPSGQCSFGRKYSNSEHIDFWDLKEKCEKND